ncbi:hypothetical protein SDC9_94276 [bioreactor metagenome]|uniref:Uncharacterized protein n=1 Tax=bioreactor metagenome TaxID=1076179 RepID=A0A645A307_9ZZZZ
MLHQHVIVPAEFTGDLVEHVAHLDQVTSVAVSVAHQRARYIQALHRLTRLSHISDLHDPTQPQSAQHALEFGFLRCAQWLEVEAQMPSCTVDQPDGRDECCSLFWIKCIRLFQLLRKFPIHQLDTVAVAVFNSAQCMQWPGSFRFDIGIISNAECGIHVANISAFIADGKSSFRCCINHQLLKTRAARFSRLRLWQVNLTPLFIDQNQPGS